MVLSVQIHQDDHNIPTRTVVTTNFSNRVMRCVLEIIAPLMGLTPIPAWHHGIAKGSSLFFGLYPQALPF